MTGVVTGCEILGPCAPLKPISSLKCHVTQNQTISIDRLMWHKMSSSHQYHHTHGTPNPGEP